MLIYQTASLRVTLAFCIFPLLIKSLSLALVMGKYAGYLIYDPQLRAWLTKHSVYNGKDNSMGVILQGLLQRDDMYPRLIRDIIPLEHEGELLFLLARVVRDGDMTPGYVREREEDMEARRELLVHSGLKEEDLKWGTCSAGYYA
ncbi:hypothetical protein P691DRAFT_788967 [Macrolepiota fuliginosa MF-IS2]|uniref:Uncharacterized protein n=1 Tax=Macrolepiota fuliginosa MF-IS2 TaxID=1400762 RepID=A0A9P5X3P1_9AGAR|nr:hypothetical protein P691DRAFT_788967 [Macrolepiota fuliginosa MF-IS2]